MNNHYFSRSIDIIPLIVVLGEVYIYQQFFSNRREQTVCPIGGQTLCFGCSGNSSDSGGQPSDSGGQPKEGKAVKAGADSVLVHAGPSHHVLAFIG